MTGAEDYFLRKWLGKPGVKEALRKEFPRVPTRAVDLGVSVLKRLVLVTSCGASQAELNALYRVLNDEKVFSFDGETIRPLTPSPLMSS